jgi:hypothetical protein
VAGGGSQALVASGRLESTACFLICFRDVGGFLQLFVDYIVLVLCSSSISSSRHYRADRLRLCLWVWRLGLRRITSASTLIAPVGSLGSGPQLLPA